MPLVTRHCAREGCTEEFEVEKSLVDSGGGRYHSAECQADGIYSGGKDRFGMDLSAPSGRINAVLEHANGKPLAVDTIADLVNRNPPDLEQITIERVQYHLNTWTKKSTSKFGRVLRQIDNLWFLETHNRSNSPNDEEDSPRNNQLSRVVNTTPVCATVPRGSADNIPSN